MRISLKYLLGVFVFCSVILWCAAQVGFDNRVFWVAAIVSAAMSFLFVLLALQETGRWLTFIFPIPSAFFVGVPFLFFSQTLLVNAFLLSLVGMYCAYKPPLPLATLSTVVMLCAVISFVSGVLPGQEEVRQLRALRNTYPTISLEDRLQYEQPAD